METNSGGPGPLPALLDGLSREDRIAIVNRAEERWKDAADHLSRCEDKARWFPRTHAYWTERERQEHAAYRAIWQAFAIYP